ncbi:MAG TPA: hypothetical protein VEA99_14660 [Gemmatimonadaceae bacterium]|nr:hypothetical protein [Gemmatimonadaceae bacterium]
MTDRAGAGEADGAREGTPSASPARGRERKSMLLRLDPTVHEALARWAADDLRSTNAHVEWLLRRALEQAGRLGPEDTRRGR